MDGLDGNNVKQSGTQTINGSKTFTSPLKCTTVNAGTGLTAVWSLTELRYISSDARLKENIIDSPYGLAEILQLEPVQFDWREDGRHDAGFIAQQVAPIIPEAAPYVEPDDRFGYRDTPIVAALVKAVQELNAKLEQLQCGQQ